LAPSDLSLDDPGGSKIKVILFDMKYVNGKSYDVGPNGDYIVPMGFALDAFERSKVKVTIL